MNEFITAQDEPSLPVPHEKLFNLNAIMIGTFLGGPVAGGYLLYSNYVMLGAPERGKQVLLYAVLLMYILLGGLFMLPEPTLEKIPRYLIPWLSAAAAYFIAKKLQGGLIAEHGEAGGQFYTRWRALWVAIVCVIATLLLLLPLVIFL